MNVKIQQIQLELFYNNFHQHFRFSVEIEQKWQTLNDHDAMLTAQYLTGTTILLFRDRNASSDAHKFISELTQRYVVGGPFTKIDITNRPVYVHSKMSNRPTKIEPMDMQPYDVLYFVSMTSYKNVVGLQQYLQEFMPEAEQICIYTTLEPEKDSCRGV